MKQGIKSWFIMSPDEYDVKNPPIQKPLMRSDGLYFKAIHDHRWTPVGYIPTPRTRLEWFLYHLAHGIAMRYRFLPVLFYSFREAFWDKLDREVINDVDDEWQAGK